MLVKNLKLENPFTNDKPGRHWYDAFFKRHPRLTKRKPQQLSYSRATVTEAAIRGWFKEIEDYFVENGLLSIGPERKFNCDESGFRLNPESGGAIVTKGTKHVHKVVSANEKEQLTALFIANAEGLHAPPLVLFNCVRLKPEIIANFPQGWSIGKTENGWMTAVSFYEYVVNVFYPWLLEQQIQFPVVLYMDGHKSHFTLPLSEFCKDHDIVLVALYPNSTHVMQPLDRAFFKPLKCAWSDQVENYKHENCTVTVRKEVFGKILKLALDSVDSKKIIKNGFEVCGLHPFNPENVDYSLCNMYDRQMESPKTSDVQESAVNLTLLETLQNNLDPNLIREFEGCAEDGLWIGDMKNEGLFDFWRKLKYPGT